VLPLAGIYHVVGGAGGIAGDPEQGAESVEGIVPPVEAENEFVEVGLQMLMAHAVMDPDQPGLQVGEDEVGDGQEGFGFVRITALGDGMVIVAPFAKAGVGASVVGDDQRPCRHRALDKAAQRYGGAVGHHSQADPSGIAAVLPFVLSGARLAVHFEPGAITRPAISARASSRSRDPRRPSRRGISSLRIIPSTAAT